MATLKDIAGHLGLSVTQVSRALNGHSDVNEDTRARVQAAARALSYQPNLSARKLVSGRSGMVGLVVSRHDNPGADAILLEVVAGLSQQFSGRGMQFVLHITDGGEPILPVYQRLIGNGALDGFVLTDPLDEDPRIGFLQEAGVPFVMHGRNRALPDYPFFDIDNEGLARTLTDLLLQAGHRRIALLNGVAGRSYVSARNRGWRAALAAAGITPPAHHDLSAEMDEAHGLTATVRLFSGPGPRPTALICGNVRIARGVFQALQALRLSVPGDVSVVAHDDHLPDLRASAFFPGLTVTKAPLRDSWAPLADCLTGAIAGQPLSALQRVGDYRVIPRASVGPPPAD